MDLLKLEDEEFHSDFTAAVAGGKPSLFIFLQLKILLLKFQPNSGWELQKEEIGDLPGLMVQRSRRKLKRMLVALASQ
jgi:hypothetical protein